jgi:ComF family protein
MEIPIVGGTACACCGDPLAAASELDKRTVLCRACRLAPPAFERAVAYGLYEDRMRAAIHALKYDRMYPAARRLGAMLAQAMVKLEGEAPAEMLVVPVPLHRSKHGQRGFNQARALAAEALRALRTSHPEWRLTLAAKTLMRLRATETQAGLSPRQRRQNVRGAFQVADSQAVRGRHILLIDDILTTGATARAASLALKRAGAKTVWVATLARAGRVFPSRAEGFQTKSYDQEPEIEPEGTSLPGTHGAPEEASGQSSGESSEEFI